MSSDDEGVDLFPGLYRGIVVDNDDPAGSGQILVTIPVVHGPTDTFWALPCASPGVLRPPPIRSVVWLMFEHADPEHPVWLGVLTLNTILQESEVENLISDLAYKYSPTNPPPDSD